MDDTENLPECHCDRPSLYYHSSYNAFNFFVIGVFTVIVGFIGLRYNSLVISVYSSRSHRRNSTAFFLCALACSDFCMIFTTMFLTTLQTWSRVGNFLTLNYVYAMSNSFVKYLSFALQTLSIYICLATAVNCLIAKPCTLKRAKVTVFTTTCICFLSYIPLIPSEEAVRCTNEYSLPMLMTCTTSFGSSHAFRMYLAFIFTPLRALIAFPLLMIVGICLVVKELRKRFHGKQLVPTTANNYEQFDIETDHDCDQLDSEVNQVEDYTVSVIVVVFFFGLLHFTFLLNFFEQVAMYVWHAIDIAYFCMITNCTIKFFIYLKFEKSFGVTLNKIRS